MLSEYSWLRDMSDIGQLGPKIDEAHGPDRVRASQTLQTHFNFQPTVSLSDLDKLSDHVVQRPGTHR